ncbi:hypothetical protein [Nonomuraea zeae]|uniref:Uncharacterized protein n=1 Tax=Nonomuraea zeae TaxID=1642303 RepID=A0A5S4G3G3_9ACTN|nr:hypothetical protein [Nonomuraea zeae]TMR27518.1 hypothetical protein ETD85_38905 [Nonomuraea zeae]
MQRRLTTALAAVPFAATFAAAGPATASAAAATDGCGTSRVDWVGHFVQAGGKPVDIRADRSASVEGREYHLVLVNTRESISQRMIGDAGSEPALNLSPQCTDTTKPSKVTGFTYRRQGDAKPSRSFMREATSAVPSVKRCRARVKNAGGAQLYRYEDYGLMAGFAMKPISAKIGYATCLTRLGRTLAGDFRYDQPTGDARSTPFYNKVRSGGTRQTFYRLLAAGELSYEENRLYVRDGDLVRCPSAECDKLAGGAARHGSQHRADRSSRQHGPSRH